MEIYLCIITTVLVITQIIRVSQNVVQLRKQERLLQKQLASIEDITNEDIETRRKAIRLLVTYLEDRVQNRKDTQ